LGGGERKSRCLGLAPKEKNREKYAEVPFDWLIEETLRIASKEGGFGFAGRNEVFP